MKNWHSGANLMRICVKLVFVGAMGLIGCATADQTVDSETMYIKGSALTKLSAAVEARVRYEAPPEGINDQELLTLATKHDPSLLKPFAGYTLKVNKQSNHAILLMCNQDGTQGLLEDAGCSTPMDKYLWQTDNPCAFTLSAEVVCSLN